MPLVFEMDSTCATAAAVVEVRDAVGLACTMLPHAVIAASARARSRGTVPRLPRPTACACGLALYVALARAGSAGAKTPSHAECPLRAQMALPCIFGAVRIVALRQFSVPFSHDLSVCLVSRVTNLQPRSCRLVSYLLMLFPSLCSRHLPVLCSSAASHSTCFERSERARLAGVV